MSPSAPASPPATPAAKKLVVKPWVYLGISKSTFYRIPEAERPRPVKVPGCSRPHWRAEDLDKWAAKLPARRG